MPKKHHFNDPLCMPGTGEAPQGIYRNAVPVENTVGAEYLEKRGIPLHIANQSGVRFVENFNERPAVIVAVKNQYEELVSVHGRYLTTVRGQNKMLTVGQGDGVISVQDGLNQEPLILVEGFFDALSLATCGWGSVALIGRPVSWLPEFTENRTVWLAFDACKQAELDVLRYEKMLDKANIHRVKPLLRCKDWNTALVKRGALVVAQWLEKQKT